MSDEGETLVIVGTCGEISEKNGWTAFSISVPGKDYPVKLSTKLAPIVEKGRAVGDGIATWTYTEKDSGKENPNRPGTFYKDRWLQGVVAGDLPADLAKTPDAPTASVSPARESTYEGLSYGDKERSIIRQTCIKAACELYSSTPLPEEDTGAPVDWPLVVMQAADRFERWIVRDLSDVPF